MKENAKTSTDDELVKDMANRSENVGFAAEEMLKCDKCGRTNPPNRLKCFYCAAELNVPDENVDLEKLNLRQLESWEKGFNVVGRENPGSSVDRRTVARDVGLERETVEKIFSLDCEMPLVRVESEQEAELICRRLKKHGIEAKVVPDELLSSERSPKRIRALEFRAEGIVVTDFNTGDRIDISASDPLLIVVGKLFELKRTSFEKKKKKTSKVVEESETSADESVLDLYAGDDQVGFRIYQSGFDFSCLGEDKSLLASENMPKLVRKLTAAYPNAKLDESYLQLQEVLNIVWEIDSRRDSKGLQRSGFGKTDFARVVTLNNQTQFTRYSRLRRLLAY